MSTTRKFCLIAGCSLLILYILWTYVLQGVPFDFRDALRVIYGNGDESYATLFKALGHLGVLVLAFGLILYTGKNSEEESE